MAHYSSLLVGVEQSGAGISCTHPASATSPNSVRQEGRKQHEAVRTAVPRDLAPYPDFFTFTLAFDPRHGAGRRAAAADCALHLPLPTR